MDASQKIFVSGCYDLLHSGHVQFFRDAKALGTHLTVCVPTDDGIRNIKHRTPALLLKDRVQIIRAIRYVDEVCVGSDPMPLNFRTEFLKRRPHVLAVTTDDRFADEKEQLCRELGARYHQLPKQLTTGLSTTQIRRRILTPTETPLRVDFSGAWLDVPKHSRSDGYIVNMTMLPSVSLQDWPYQKGAGLGGSAAYARLKGNNPFETEADMGVGWQDPAILAETGLCVWQSGQQPVLISKINPDWLADHLFLYWTGKSHHTPDLTDRRRPYDLIVRSSRLAKLGAERRDLEALARGSQLYYEAQLEEGMDELPNFNQMAKKYLGGGFGGYALYIFGARMPDHADLTPIHPYMASVGHFHVPTLEPAASWASGA